MGCFVQCLWLGVVYASAQAARVEGQSLGWFIAATALGFVLGALGPTRNG